MPKSSAIRKQRVAEREALQGIHDSNQVWLRAIFAAKQKSEKKIQQKKDEEEAKMKRVIQNAITPQPVASDPWRNLFT